jgi:hypothetical protein
MIATLATLKKSPKYKNTAVQSTYTYSNPVCRRLATSFPYTSTCVTYCADFQVSIVFCVSCAIDHLLNVHIHILEACACQIIHNYFYFFFLPLCK